MVFSGLNCIKPGGNVAAERWGQQLAIAFAVTEPCLGHIASTGRAADSHSSWEGP